MGKAGFNLKIPIMQGVTNGCSAKFTPFSKTSIEESAERAVFIALYFKLDL